jgi:ubiquinone/menaquinone biosynthesis C-methylase UbiE
MNSLENWFCASGLWRSLTEQKWLPLALEGTDLGEHVLEVGAGPGAATNALAARTGRVTSLEYSHCVDLREEVGAASVVQGDAAILPFKDHTFSSAIAVLVLHHLRSREAQDRAFAEIHRVLKPGGVFLAMEIADSWLARALHIRSTFIPVATDQLGSRLHAAGFSNAQVTNRSGGFLLRAQRA